MNVNVQEYTLPDCWPDSRDNRANRPDDRVSTWPSHNPIILMRSWSLDSSQTTVAAISFSSEIAISSAHNLGTSPGWPFELFQCFRIPEVVLYVSVHPGNGQAYISMKTRSVEV
jgi:hypothetical protein